MQSIVGEDLRVLNIIKVESFKNWKKFWKALSKRKPQKAFKKYGKHRIISRNRTDLLLAASFEF